MRDGNQWRTGYGRSICVICTAPQVNAGTPEPPGPFDIHGAVHSLDPCEFVSWQREARRLSGQARFQEDVGAKRAGIGHGFFRSGSAFFNATGWQVFQRCIVADAASFLACSRTDDVS
jgi:hypothetical protein